MGLFGIKLGGDKKKKETVQTKPWPKIDQNMLGEGQFFGQNVLKPVIIKGVDSPAISRPGTSHSMRQPMAPYMNGGGASSMLNLGGPGGHSQRPSISSLRQYGSEANLGMRFQNSSLASLTSVGFNLPMPVGPGSRPGTSDGQKKKVHPMAFAYGSNPNFSPFISANNAPRSPLAQTSFQLDLPSDNASLMGDKHYLDTKDSPSPPKAYPSPPQSLKASGAQSPMNMRDPRSQNLNGSFAVGNLPSPTASVSRSSEEKQWGAPVIQNVKAKRDTLTIDVPRRQSLSMEVESATERSMGFNFFDDDDEPARGPNAPQNRAPPSQQGRGGPGTRGNDSYFPPMNGEPRGPPRGDRILPPNGPGGPYGPGPGPNRRPGPVDNDYGTMSPYDDGPGRKPGPPPGQERPSSPYGMERRRGPPEGRPSSPFGSQRRGPPPEGRPSSPFGSQRRGPPPEGRPSSPFGSQRRGPPGEERSASPFGMERRRGPPGEERPSSPYGMRRGPPPEDRPRSPYGEPRRGPSNGEKPLGSPFSGPPGGMRHGPAPIEGEANGPGPAIVGPQGSGRRPGPPPIRVEPRDQRGPPPGAVGARRGGQGPGRDHPQRFRMDDDDGPLQRKASNPQFRNDGLSAPRYNSQRAGGPPTPDSSNWPLGSDEPLASPTFPGSRPRTPQSGKPGPMNGNGLDESAMPAPLGQRPRTPGDRGHSPAITPLEGDSRFFRQEGARPPPRPTQGGVDFGLRTPTGVADDFRAGFI